MTSGTDQVRSAAGGAWSVTGFRRLWLANTADAWAVSLLPAVVTLALVHRGSGALVLGPVLAAKTVGFVLATVPGGVLADRWSRRRTMALACALRAVAALLLPVALLGPGWAAAACVFLVGAGEGAFRPSYQAMVGDLVPEERRQSANALSTITFRLALVLAPGAATAAVLWVGPWAVLVLTAALWCVAALAVRRLPERHTDRARPEGSAVAQFRSGVREARRHRWFVAGLVMLVFVLAVGEAAQLVLLPVISNDRFGTDFVYAAALTAYSVGALAGGAVMARWNPALPGLVAVLGLALYAGIPLALALSPVAWPLLVAYALAGVGMELFNVPWFSALQREVPPHLRARVSSLDFMVSYSMSPLGLALLPLVVEATGTTTALIGTAVVVLVACAGTLAVPGMTRFRTREHRSGGVPEGHGPAGR
ncbi:MFS transporter [Saccharothrix australiensis]|uniref:Putative MFS family arabinose efflux permease n=1 Tax=Saccharothrix australiensis TaxID=2072 RepID=A0A495VY32_9PSEU|nr:MFS transporter [Saccharothrix australiensis]RKT53740.1 putative MFS family arabinose efflux permease [Saccharothrix australiensis]